MADKRADLAGPGVSTYPEVEKILNLGAPYTSMPAALAEFFLKDKHVLVAAGTHGKTTTSFLLDHVLTTAGWEPTTTGVTHERKLPGGTPFSLLQATLQAWHPEQRRRSMTIASRPG